MELKPTRMNYEIKEISNSRSEIKIRMKNINDDVYMQNFEDRLEPLKKIEEIREYPLGPRKYVFIILLILTCLQLSMQDLELIQADPPVDDDPIIHSFNFRRWSRI